ncbi:hypothetical protein BpHYR1_043047, partial [Brachionus plicatilis]
LGKGAEARANIYLFIWYGGGCVPSTLDFTIERCTITLTYYIEYIYLGFLFVEELHLFPRKQLTNTKLRTLLNLWPKIFLQLSCLLFHSLVKLTTLMTFVRDVLPKIVKVPFGVGKSFL